MASSSNRPYYFIADAGASSTEDDNANLAHSFQNLGLENEVEIISSLIDSLLAQTENDEVVSSDTQFNRELGKLPMISTSLSEEESSLNQSIPQEVNLGYHPFNNTGDTQHYASENSLDSMNNINQYHPNNYVEIIGRTNNDYGGRSLYNSMNQFGRNSVPSNPRNFYQEMGNYGMNYSSMGQLISTNRVESSRTPSNGYYIGDATNMPNRGMQSPGSWWTQGGDLNAETFLKWRNVAKLAADEYSSENIISKIQHDPYIRSTVFEAVLKYPFDLIKYKHGCTVFQCLIAYCDDSQLQQLVQNITSDIALFFDAVNSEYGSNSLQSLVKCIKSHTELAQLVTRAASTNICAMVSSPQGRGLVRECLKLSRGATQVLYNATIIHCFDLAMNPRGCIILGECINAIESPQRDFLLNLICEESACLSFDPSGNYVVQKVLGLQNIIYSSIICQNLQGHYVRLSQMQPGSFLVEKCLRASRCGGLDLFFQEIYKDPRLLEKLARHEYGNYVVQVALDVSKEGPTRGGKYYEAFVRILKPCFRQLERNRFGANVVRKIRAVKNRF